MPPVPGLADPHSVHCTPIPTGRQSGHLLAAEAVPLGRQNLGGGSLGTVLLEAESYFGRCGGLTAANTDLNYALCESLLLSVWQGVYCLIGDFNNNYVESHTVSSVGKLRGLGHLQ